MESCKESDKESKKTDIYTYLFIYLEEEEEEELCFSNFFNKGSSSGGISGINLWICGPLRLLIVGIFYLGWK